jgi:hypothetical protein
VSAAAFDDALRGWSARSDTGQTAIILSDLLLDGYQDGVRRLLAAHAAVVVLHVLSPDELRPDGLRDVDLIDSETGEHLRLRLGDASLSVYRRRVAAWLAETEAWCRRQGVVYCLVRSDWDTERVLLETLRGRRVLL